MLPSLEGINLLGIASQARLKKLQANNLRLLDKNKSFEN
jgi:hypothetical protein